MQLQISVIIPTYNRRVILRKALEALNRQTLDSRAYEVIVIDDGSTDGTQEMIQQLKTPYSLVYRFTSRRGPAAARNLGLKLARADLIVFIDSDIVVNEEFLEAHLKAHTEPHYIGHGPVIHTDNLDDPTSASFKVTDISRAFFATGNASIRKEHLFAAGLFDESFVEYGWEDLELGIRLRRLGLKAVKVPKARGYHYKKKLAAADVPIWRQRERERGHTAVAFYRKVPTCESAHDDDALSAHLLARLDRDRRRVARPAGDPAPFAMARPARLPSCLAVCRPPDHAPRVRHRDARGAGG